MRTVRSALLAAAFLAATAPAALSQIRPDVRLREILPSKNHISGQEATTVSHDPDSDGAFLGGAIGALGLGLVGGLAGLVIGGLIDASDAFEGPSQDLRGALEQRRRERTLLLPIPAEEERADRRPQDGTAAGLHEDPRQLLVFALCDPLDGGRHLVGRVDR
ncbi:hypothetical protein BH18GEM1_BH18GEM1_19120 [soil metagenome]